MSKENNDENRAPTAFGVAWYSPEEWTSIQEYVSDPETFDYPYHEWLANAEESIKTLQRTNSHVYRIPFRIEDFLLWCQTEHRQPNAEARAAYASFETKRIYG